MNACPLNDDDEILSGSADAIEMVDSMNVSADELEMLMIIDKAATALDESTPRSHVADNGNEGGVCDEVREMCFGGSLIKCC